MAKNETIDWSLCTWEGSRRAQLRAWRRLTLREQLEALEELADLARWFEQRRRGRRLPAIPLQSDDPATVAARGEGAVR